MSNGMASLIKRRGAAGLATLLSILAPFLANRADFRVVEPLPVPRTTRGPLEWVLDRFYLPRAAANLCIV